jgi:response regulator RpfG family c-di-GMP phosphodiesterase
MIENIKDTKVTEILVLDDSNTNVVLLEAILAEQGYQITPALSAREAFKAIDKKIPDLILLDLLMPKVSGYDFLEKLKQNEHTKTIPIIVISAVTDQQNINKIMEMGADEFIGKPLDIEILLDKVNNILK